MSGPIGVQLRFDWSNGAAAGFLIIVIIERLESSDSDPVIKT